MPPTALASQPTGTPAHPVGAIGPMVLDFLAYLELERGLSRNTLVAYRTDLLQFGEFLDRGGLSAATVGHGELAAFLSELGAHDGEPHPWRPARSRARRRACAPSTATCAARG